MPHRNTTNLQHGLRVEGGGFLGFRVQGLGFRVRGNACAAKDSMAHGNKTNPSRVSGLGLN